MATDLEQPSSIVFVQASELFPKKTLASDDDSIQVPFPVLNGESIEYLGQTSDAILALSNFRLFIRFKDSFVNVPLRLIEFIGMKDPSLMEVNCKDARSFKILFDTNEQSLNWFEKLNQCISPVSRLEDLFAFPFYAWCMDDKQCFRNSGEDAESLDFCQRGGGQYSFMSEVRRMGFDNLQNAWRITDINTNFELCSTYPKLHIVPAKISDDNVKAVVKFRTSGRFPSVVWRHMTNGAVIARCSQPEVGLLGWRSPEDEALLHAIGTACAVDSVSAFKNRFLREMDHKSNRNSHTDAMPSGDIAHSETYGDNKTDSLSESGIVEQRKVLIVDARAYSAAVMNRAKGGGCECEEYYPGCEVLFMNLANIHTIRKSFQCLRMLCSGPRDAPNWWSNLEKTNWLHHISLLLKASNIVVNAIHEEQRPVVVHCSDGWDRTTQIVALAELMLDPYYRTIEGFQVLVSREWLEFGHRFADRCGHGKNPDENQRCPVFLQWLDCVHQLTRQFPCSFEFNETYLVKLAQHTYSCLFGTFLCNSENEQLKGNIPKRTFSVWSLFKMKKREYRNFLYSSSSEQVFQASCQPRCLQLWSAVYLAHPTPYSEALLLENGDTSDYGDSVSSACITPVSPIFPNDGIDHEEVTRSSHVVTSKSDGNLACKLCLKNRNELDEKNKQFISFDSNLKSRSCPECRTDFYENGVQCNVVEAVASESRSLYLSAQSDSNAVSIVSCDDSISEVESMSSSTATIILDPSEGDLTVESRHSSSEKISSGHLIKETNETKCLEEDSSAHKEQRFEEGSNEQSVTVDGSAFCRAMICDEEKTECVESISQELFTNSGSASTFTGPVQGTSSSTTTLRASSSELFTKYLDVDGLTYISDPVQERLRQIEMDHQANLELLQRQVIDAQRRRTALSEKFRLAWRLQGLFQGEGFVIKALQHFKSPPNSSRHVHRKVLKLCYLLVRRSQPSKIVPPLVAATGWFGASKFQEKSPAAVINSNMSEMENDFKTVDDLCDNNELQKAYDLLMKYKEPQKSDVEWRLAKVKRMMAEESKDTQKKKELTYEAFDHAKLALSLDDKNFAAHKWYAITLSFVGEYEGTKAKLQNAFVMKEHFEKAIELNPSDATSRHVLGVWCFTFADMGWVTRKLAATIFASPPTSSYEEALGHFQKAEELDPNFYAKNHVFLGKTFLRLKKMDEAKIWLDKAANSNPKKTADDKAAKKEAEEMLQAYF